jgi:hypothetical protein
MRNEAIPEAVRQFLLEYIDSVPQLEALLLMRESPAEDWTSEMVLKRLYINPPAASDVLAALCARGLLVPVRNSTSAYRYCPRAAELASVVDCLAETYRLQLIPVTNLIHSKSSSSIQRFADAFRMRRDS